MRCLSLTGRGKSAESVAGNGARHLKRARHTVHLRAAALRLRRLAAAAPAHRRQHRLQPRVRWEGLRLRLREVTGTLLEAPPLLTLQK